MPAVRKSATAKAPRPTIEPDHDQEDSAPELSVSTDQVMSENLINTGPQITVPGPSDHQSPGSTEFISNPLPTTDTSSGYATSAPVTLLSSVEVNTPAYMHTNDANSTFQQPFPHVNTASVHPVGTSYSPIETSSMSNENRHLKRSASVMEQEMTRSLETVVKHARRDDKTQSRQWDRMISSIPSKGALPRLKGPESWALWKRSFDEMVNLTASAYIFYTSMIPEDVLVSEIHDCRNRWWLQNLRGSVDVSRLIDAPYDTTRMLIWIESKFKPNDGYLLAKVSAEAANLSLGATKQPIAELIEKYHQIKERMRTLGHELPEFYWRYLLQTILAKRTDKVQSWFGERFEVKLDVLLHELQTSELSNTGQSSSEQSNNWINFKGKATHPKSVNLATFNENENLWRLDSGSDAHISNLKEHFAQLELQEGPELLSANGTSLNSAGCADIVVDTPKGKLWLQDVYYCPNSSECLISTSALEEAGCSVTWQSSPNPILIRTPEGQNIEFMRQGKGYFCNIKAASLHVNSVSESDAMIIHRRFCHLNDAAIRAVIGTRRFPHSVAIKCSDCSMAKSTIHPSHQSVERSEELWTLVYADLAGGQSSFPEGEMSGNNNKLESSIKHFLILTEDKSRYRWVYFIKNKTQVTGQIKSFMNMIRTQFGLSVKRFRTDGGREFDSIATKSVLESFGTIWEPTAAHAPQQNGVSERGIRTVVTLTRALMNQTKIPHKHWPEILRTVVYTLNRVPHPPNKISPHEFLYKTPPKTDHMKAFGSTAFVHNPNPGPKLDPRAYPMCLVGYDHVNIFRVLDPASGRVMRRRDVAIREDLPFTWPTQDLTQPLLVLSVKLLDSGAPQSYKEVLRRNDKNLWIEAMERELTSIAENNVWDLVNRPPGAKVLSGKWIYKFKDDGNFKARWVIRGFQEEDLTKHQTYAHVTHGVTIRAIFALAAHHKWYIKQADVATAFLNSDIDREIFVHTPTGYFPGNKVCHLKRSLYGLRTSPRSWQLTLKAMLESLHLVQGTIDPGVYFGKDMMVSTYVDDLLVLGPDERILDKFLQELSDKVKIKILPKLDTYLGMQIESTDDHILVHHEHKIIELLESFPNEGGRTTHTPHYNINATPSDESPLVGDEIHDTRSLLGSLQHIACYTRPDISFAVAFWSRTMGSPTTSTLNGLKHVLCYLGSTPRYGIRYKKGPSFSNELIFYSDATWVSQTESKSISGHVATFFGAPICWRSKKQTAVALSTCEAEFSAATEAVRDLEWLRRLTAELQRNKQPIPITLYVDNQAAIYVALKEGFQARNRHFLVRDAYLRQAVLLQIVDIKYISTNDMAADGFTKALANTKHSKFLKQLTIQ